MAKKKEKVEPQFALDYLQIVDSLNDEAFAFCVDAIFSVLGYRVLRKEDVRRVDLKERLREFSAQSGSLYLHILQLYFGNYLHFSAESREERLYHRALDLMKDVSKNQNDFGKLDDLVLIFIILLRPLATGAGSVEEIADRMLELSRDDAGILKKIWKNHIPSEVENMPEFMQKLQKPRTPPLEELKMTYINNVLFLCRSLQNRGEFAGEDE